MTAKPTRRHASFSTGDAALHRAAASTTRGIEPLFHKYNLEEEIAKINQRQVPLPGGGSIVIDPTEALVAIDVNSGNFRGDDSAEENAFRLNIWRGQRDRPPTATARPRRRDRQRLHRHAKRNPSPQSRDTHCAMRWPNDRARTKILRTSPFGLIEMTRQRIRPSLKRSIYRIAPAAKAAAWSRRPRACPSKSSECSRLAVATNTSHRVTIRVNDAVAAGINNNKRREIATWKTRGNMTVQILGSEGLYPEHLEMDCRDDRGERVEIDS